MKFKNILFLIIIISIFISGCTNVTNNNIDKKIEKEDINKKIEPNSENFLQILKTDKEGLEYIKKNPNIKVLNITLIKPEEFEKMRELTDYKELYLNLPQKDLYYVKFGSNSTSLSLITMIDLENRKIIKIFGVYIMGMS